MLCLYLHTLITGYNFCSLRILNKIALRKKLQNSMTNNVVVFLQKSKTETTTKHKGPPAPQSDALPQDDRDN